MTPSRGSSKGTVKLEDRVNRIKRILEELVQVVHNTHRNIASVPKSPVVPTYPNCRRKHWGKCRVGSKACYGCGQEGHQVKDCPKWNGEQGAGMSASASAQQPLVSRRKNRPRQGRAFALMLENTPTTTLGVSGILPNCD